MFTDTFKCVNTEAIGLYAIIFDGLYGSSTLSSLLSTLGNTKYCIVEVSVLLVFGGSRHQKAYFDVKVFNPNVPSYRGSQLSSLYCRFEQDKHRKYEQRIRDVEMASFTPLIFQPLEVRISGATKVFYKRLADLLSVKKSLDYSTVMSWLRCRLSFSFLRSAIDCLRGARSHHGCPANHGALDLAFGRRSSV